MQPKYSALTNALCGTFKPFIDQETQAQYDAVNKHYFAKFREEEVQEIAEPMREMFKQILNGELYEIDGVLMMEIPENKAWECVGNAELIPIHESLHGWIDCWNRIDKRLKFYDMGVLAKKIEAGQLVTEVLVRKALAEFEASIGRLLHLDREAVVSAISATQIQIYFEKMELVK
mgnify:CR=1 FL=1